MIICRTLAMVAAARERENNVRGAINEDSATQKGTKRGRKSISVISPASVSKVITKHIKFSIFLVQYNIHMF